jgi:4-amino-4-deoxy-L-arabinose transferase-like glycosyltransferase
MGWPGFLDRRGFVVVLVVLWALSYLPHLGTRDLRLEEGRRATPAREMLASGDFVRPTLYGETYLNKPPLYFWLVAAAGWLLGEVTPLAVRLPSALAALGCALLALRFAPGRLDRRTRRIAALFALASATLLDKGTLGEIDAVLSLVVAIALKCWWDGNRPDRQTASSWVAAGFWLGAAGLLKGPAGPLLFYLTIGPFLVWRGQWRRLFTPGHAAGLVLAALPSAVWVAVLLHRDIVSGPDLAGLWAHQLGAHHATIEPNPLGHFVEFPVQVFGMLFPASLLLPLAIRRSWAGRPGWPDDLACLCACGIAVPCLVLFLYPAARPRHLMPVFFPAAVLAAVVLTDLSHAAGRRARSLHCVGLLLSLVPAVVGAVGVLLAARVNPDGRPIAVAGLVVGVLWSGQSLWMSTRTTPAVGALSAGITLAGTVLAVWFMFNLIVVPWRAPLAPTRIALRSVEGKLADAEPTYTTRTFTSQEGAYFNLQFHLARDVRALPDLMALRDFAPCVVVLTPTEREHLESAGWRVEEVGRLMAPTGPPEVHVVRVGRSTGPGRPDTD